MKGKGQTLIEVIIATALFSMVIVGFIQALNVGIMGTYRTSQSNLALNLARSQVEYVKLQDYQPCTDATCNVTYKKLNASVVQSLYPGLSIDSIEIAVANVSDEDPEALQQVTVTVTYENGRYTEVVGYKAPRLAAVRGPSGWWILTGIIYAFPDPLQGKWGYYYVLETGVEGQGICATWVYTSKGPGMGNLMSLYLYEGIPEEFGDAGQGEGIVEELNSAPSGELVKEKAGWQPETETYKVVLRMQALPAGTYTAFFYNDAASQKNATGSKASASFYW